MNPLIWNDLPDIDNVPPLDETDERCLAEIREVVQKHKKERRLGVALLHQHFVLAEDELLVEHCDLIRRMLVTAPQKSSAVFERGYRPTLWRFDGVKASACAYCPVHTDDEGRSQHDGYKEPC